MMNVFYLLNFYTNDINDQNLLSIFAKWKKDYILLWHQIGGSILLTIICILISVAFFTLLERKVLGVVQNRRGPSKVGQAGILQPIADGAKLFFKEAVLPRSSIQLIFVLAPIISFVLGFLSWCFLPIGGRLAILDSSYSLLLIFIVAILHVYSIILAGWSSNSKYSFLGSLRSCAQLIAYDIAIGFVILTIILNTKSLSVSSILDLQAETGYLFFQYPLLFLIFFICALAETNRHPFDLPEAEAELVSGYNVEYSSIGFACFFLAEYASILFMVYLVIILFFGGLGWEYNAAVLPIGFYNFFDYIPCGDIIKKLFKVMAYYFGEYPSKKFDEKFILPLSEWLPSGKIKDFIFVDFRSFHYNYSWKQIFFDFLLKPTIFIYIFILIRGLLPRYRYDHLMSIGWKILLPLSFVLFMFYSFVFYI